MLMQGQCLFYAVYLKECILFDLAAKKYSILPVLPVCSKCIFNNCVWGSDVFKTKQYKI